MYKSALLVFAAALLVACNQARSPVTLHPADTPPDRLSDWGVVFADGKNFELGERVIPYELNTPLFSDYALKLRSVWLPEGKSAGFRASGPIDFPVGTIISKTFHYEKSAGFSDATFRVVKTERESALDASGKLGLNNHVLIETRLLIRYEQGWKALPYVWNDDQDEAFLELAGELRQIELLDGKLGESFVYVVPDANQCAGCHTTDHSSKALQLIGLKAWQLNRDYVYDGKNQNQIEHWSAIGMLVGVKKVLPAGVGWASPGEYSLEDRSKAYLDVNCAHCHNSVGAADTSGLNLELDTPVDRDYGVCKPPVAVGRGSGDRPYDIYPGRPEDSIMIYRMQNTDPAIAMPELGRSTVHDRGLALVTEWVASMQGEC